MSTLGEDLHVLFFLLIIFFNFLPIQISRPMLIETFKNL